MEHTEVVLASYYGDSSTVDDNGSCCCGESKQEGETMRAEDGDGDELIEAEDGQTIFYPAS